MSNLGFFCPEFDEKRGKIQENYDFRCPGLINTSFLIYRSSEVFHCKCISCTKQKNNFSIDDFISDIQFRVQIKFKKQYIITVFLIIYISYVGIRGRTLENSIPFLSVQILSRFGDTSCTCQFNTTTF